MRNDGIAGNYFMKKEEEPNKKKKVKKKNLSLLTQELC